MIKHRNVVMGVILAFALNASFSQTLTETIHLAATRLVAEQNSDTSSQLLGSWPGEEWATGSIALGLMHAYEGTGVKDYFGASSSAAAFVIREANPVFMGDGALSLVKYHELNQHEYWLHSLKEFYQLVNLVGTEFYISGYASYEPSMAVYYLAHHTHASYALDLEDKAVWREGLLAMLRAVDDTSHFPVQALAMATWVLTKIGPLEDILVDPEAGADSYWYGKRIQDLPRLLLGHLVPEGELDAGSFYWKFNHLGGPNDTIVRSGYTEDCAFGMLALLSVYERYEGAEEQLAQNSSVTLEELKSAIARLKEVMIKAVYPDGSVRAHISLGGDAYYTFAGELLHAMCVLSKYEEEGLEL
jgi:hypothetical protein